MEFFELVGVITSIGIFVFLVNLFFEKYERDNRESEENKRRLAEFTKTEKVKDEAYNKWASENPVEAKEAVDEKQVIQEKNEQYRTELDDLYDLIQEMSYLKRAGRTKLLEYLEPFKKDSPSKYWEGSEVRFPPESHNADDHIDLINNLPWSQIKESSVGMNTYSLMEIHSIPIAEMFNLYMYQLNSLREAEPDSDECLISKWHYYILNNIEQDFVILRDIANRRNTTPIYLRRE